MKGVRFLFLLALFACSPTPPEANLPPGRPVFEALGAASAPVRQLEVSARPPGVQPWTVRLEKDAAGTWRLLHRSDLASTSPDLADGKLVEHLVGVVKTFATETEAPKGNDASYGLAPYRLEVRLGAGPVLRIGDATGANGVYFRVGESGKTWIGRGALLAFLPTIETPASFASKSPFRTPLDEIRSVRLRKIQGRDRASWEFFREENGWRLGKNRLSEEKAAVLDRVFRQRIVGVLPVRDLAESTQSDWALTVRSARNEETLSLLFSLNQVFGKNPARTDRALELYPEFAGALRAFTQARFTPVKSGTK